MTCSPSGDAIPDKKHAAQKGRGYVNTRSRWSDEWATPRDFFDALHTEFRFTLDACAKPWNATLPRFVESGGLAYPWAGERVFCNPPYSNIGPWLAKSAESPELAVFVVPCVPDRKWWAEHVEGHASEVRHVSGKRLYFTAAEGQKPKRAPFPSVVLVYRNAA